MICTYANKSKESEGGRHYLYCKITSLLCPMVRYCNRIGDIVNVDLCDKKCVVYQNEEGKKYMEQGKYKVLRCKNNMLYIELDYNTSIIVPNPFGSDIPKGVDLIKVKDEYYIKGYEPKVEVEPKMATSTNKKNKIKD